MFDFEICWPLKVCIAVASRKGNNALPAIRCWIHVGSLVRRDHSAHITQVSIPQNSLNSLLSFC